METSTTFGHENEPELQKLAPFLRERCEKRKYGLQYLNAEKTHIRIPWPTVPRANEEVHESFKMFTEWAILSFRKRGNKSDHLQNEALSAQKHRFRNALGRADGLKYCKEMSTDSIRVYEFADTKKDKDSHDNTAHRHDRIYNVNHVPFNRNTSPHQEYADSNSTIEYHDWEQMNTTAVTMVTSPNQNPAYSQAMIGTARNEPPTQFESVMYPIDDGSEQVTSLSTLLEEMMNTPAPASTPNGQGYGNDYTHYNIIPDPALPTPENGQIPQQQNFNQASNHMALPQYPNPGTEATHPNMNGYLRQQDHHVMIKVMYRGEVVMRKPVTNSVGFRIYFGNNVPDMSRLLDSQQRNQLAQLTRFQCEELYGPDSFEQVEMPTAPMYAKHANQLYRTSQVLQNMDRGLVFYLEHSAPGAIPNVYSIRLCQTRVFPYESNVEGRETLKRDGLKRMEWAQVFDAGEFLGKLETWGNFPGPAPSASIKLSVGQKPKPDENNNLVSISIMVTKAQGMLDSYMEDIPEEICISSKNSMDVAAQFIQSRIQSSIRLEDENPMVRY